MEKIYKKTLAELSVLVRKKELKPSEICAGFLSRYEETEQKINAFITLDKEAVMKRAKELDAERITPETSAVFGIPVAVKDNICTRDFLTTCASKMLEKFRPSYDATVVSRLKQSGAVIMGKTNMDEFAMGSSSNTSYFGPVRNPHNTSLVPGGSSGGSAAAVAAGSAPAALGSDTGGSIRLPAAYCGVVGYKPSYGAVSRYGLLAYAGSFDQIGPIARTVSDAALIAAATGGYDPLDGSSDPKFVPNFSSIENYNAKGKKIGIPREYFDSEDISGHIRAAYEKYKSSGAELVDISIPSVKHSMSVYCAIANAEASSNFARYDGLRFGYRSENSGDIDSLYINSRTEGLGKVVKRRIWLGTYILSVGNYDVYYKKAQLVRAEMNEEFKAAFEKCDVIFTPVTHIAPFKIDAPEPDTSLTDMYTVPANITGLPAISLPCAVNRNGLPVNFQLIGKRFDDANLLGMARVFERESGMSNIVAEVKRHGEI